jgi:probable HAF family extracellular repeat protein
LAVNNSGQIVGFSESGNAYQAFLYSNGTTTPLGFLGTANGKGLDNGNAAIGINGSGQVVGASAIAPCDNPPIHAFLYSNGR